MQVARYHIKGHHILERDFTCPVTLHKDLVDDLGAAASRKAENEGLTFGGFEGLDAA